MVSPVTIRSCASNCSPPLNDIPWKEKRGEALPPSPKEMISTDIYFTAISPTAVLSTLGLPNPVSSMQLYKNNTFTCLPNN